MYFFGQMSGFVAMTFSVLSNLQHVRRHILFFKFLSDILWVISFYLIGSFPACVTTSIAIGREFVFYNKGKKWADSKIWIGVFALMFLSSSLLTMKNIYGLLPAVSSVFSTFAFYCTDVKKMKLLLIAQSSGMLMYNCVYRSPAGICDALLAILAIFISFIHVDLSWIKSGIAARKPKTGGAVKPELRVNYG